MTYARDEAAAQAAREEIKSARLPIAVARCDAASSADVAGLFERIAPVDVVVHAAGFTPHPTYEEVCSGGTGHNEVVLVIYDPAQVSYEKLLSVFWESHDPTQGMRQGNDAGTQYRSGIYTFDDEQAKAAAASKEMVGPRLAAAGHGPITTEIARATGGSTVSG